MDWDVELTSPFDEDASFAWNPSSSTSALLTYPLCVAEAFFFASSSVFAAPLCNCWSPLSRALFFSCFVISFPASIWRKTSYF
jgi:hypothetical protein